MLLTMIFNVIFFYNSINALENQLFTDYKKVRSNLEINKFALTENYYFLFGTVSVKDYEDDIEFFAEANAYQNLEIFAFKKICWPKFLKMETRVKIFYEYLNTNPLFDQNKNIIVLKKQKKKNYLINIIYAFDRKINTINFPTNEKLGIINKCA